jgi:putative redox protein
VKYNDGNNGMTTHATKVVWREGLAFEGNQNGVTLPLSGASTDGDREGGLSPKQLLLTALAGCTAMDVASLLPKMRVPFEAFRVEVEGDVSDQHPKVYNVIRLVYIVKAAETSRLTIEDAIRLSVEKYCGVHAMLAMAATITHELRLEA